ncbi:hypothetical protein [Streptomyces chrestomyceticus]|uniref:hypothetical protein n=1 Tax=Streptomyces chrestomyceticus TaxID=68185 RepID=UPI0033D09F94
MIGRTDVGPEDLAGMLRAALGARRRESYRGLVQVMATAPATVARVAPLDDWGAVAASLNVLDRERGSSVIYVDRWAAAVRLGRVAEV